MIVLDTHALLWWASESSELSERARQRIEAGLAEGEPVLVSAISFWEIAMLVARGRLALTMEPAAWLEVVENQGKIDVVPLSARLAMQSVTLPGDFHKDPADRMIVALARASGAVLISADEKIQRYPHVHWLW